MCMMVIPPSTCFFLTIITVTIPALQTVGCFVVGNDVYCKDALVLITVIGDDVQCKDALVLMTVIWVDITLLLAQSSLSTYQSYHPCHLCPHSHIAIPPTYIYFSSSPLCWAYPSLPQSSLNYFSPPDYLTLPLTISLMLVYPSTASEHIGYSQHQHYEFPL